MSRILIVDDHPLYRDGLKCFLEKECGMVCCGEADSYQAALNLAAQCEPELVIADLRLRKLDGLELIKALRINCPRVKILVLSHKDESSHAEQAIRCGALGYIMKEEATEELRTAIQSVLKGEIYVSRRMSSLLIKKNLHGACGDEIQEKLSDREFQVFELLGTGLGSREIAAQLHLSVKTIEAHREGIKHKLDLSDAQSLSMAAKNWLLASPS